MNNNNNNKIIKTCVMRGWGGEVPLMINLSSFSRSSYLFEAPKMNKFYFLFQNQRRKIQLIKFSKKIQLIKFRNPGGRKVLFSSFLSVPMILQIFIQYYFYIIMFGCFLLYVSEKIISYENKTKANKKKLNFGSNKVNM